MSALPTVLIFTYSEYGQANVNLATSYELALAGVNVHVASFASLRTRVSRLQELISQRTSSSDKPTGSIAFHECVGFSPWEEAVKRRGLNPPDVRHSCTVSGALESYSNCVTITCPWGPEEYLAAIESCKEIITTIKPNLVMIDIAFFLAKGACDVLKQKFMLMMPISPVGILAGMQPYLAALWKYPAVSSGLPFPLKWWQVPLNAYLNFRLARSFQTSTDLKKMQLLHKSLGTQPAFDHQLWQGVVHICPAFAEIDFPFAFIPDEIRFCGPIIIPFKPLEECDQALMKWLDNGLTVMINLGSHVISDDKMARAIGGAIRMLLDRHNTKNTRKLQVLWKAKGSDTFEEAVHEVIGKEIREGRVKVVAWLDPEPVSILQHPNVVCTVHHGGANSFYEGVWSGLPQIALPVWYDTYQFASRVETLNIGIFGNRSCAPDVRAEEFGQALVAVMGETHEANKFRAAAKHLKELCRAKGNGRVLASREVLKEIGLSK